MIGPLLKNPPPASQQPQPAPTSAQRTTTSSWSNAFKSLRFSSSTNPSSSSSSSSSSTMTSKKWYLNPTNQSQHSLMHYQHHHPQSSMNLPSFSLENTGSSILAAQQLGQLWRWLPTRYQILELQLVYSTNIHGCRLMTLMDKCEFYAATIIVIQTTNNSVFGAYCSQPWSKRISPDR